MNHHHHHANNGKLDRLECLGPAWAAERERATDDNEKMLQLLKSLQDTVGDVDRMRIDQLLADVTENVADAASTIRKSSDKQKAYDDDDDEEEEEEEEGEATISAEVGSNEDLDNMDEDILQDEQSQATGFVGKTSEIQWLRKLNHEAAAASHSESVASGPYGPPGSDAKASAYRADAFRQRQIHDASQRGLTKNFSFNLDDENIDIDYTVNLYDLPPLETADRLVQCYINSVHESFPIIAKKTFVNSFYQYYASLAQGAPYELSQKWQALLNLVFAIGSVYSHLTGGEWSADARDHFLYHSRALNLALTDQWWISNPDLPQTQITGLLALYYLAIGHTNRAWVVIGMAVRSGFSLGLHIRNEDRKATAVKKEILARLWWGLYTLERLLTVITGRPSIGIEMHCSVYLPLPISCNEFEEARIRALFGAQPRPTINDEPTDSETSGTISSASSSPHFRPSLHYRDSANSGTYLISQVKIAKISHRILTEVYSPSVVKESWKHVQEKIAEIIEDLEVWASSLPSGLDILSNKRGDETMAYERSKLRIQYHSMKILVSRPCLCRLDYRIPNQSRSSYEFNQKTAALCVSTAKVITALLPDDMFSDPSCVYRIFPWWATVHYIVQSLAVLMLGLSSEAPSVNEWDDTVIPIKKLVRWLRALRSNNGMARRAHSIVLSLLQKMISHIPIDVSDLVAEDLAESLPTEHRTSSPSLLTADFQELYSSYQQRYASYLADGNEPDAYPAPNTFQQPLQPNPQLTNPFFTEFDLYDPFQFGSGDVVEGDPTEERAGSSATTGGGGGIEGSSGSAG